MDGEYFWNICDFWEEESTRDGARGGARGRGARPGPSWAPRNAVVGVKTGGSRVGSRTVRLGG